MLNNLNEKKERSMKKVFAILAICGFAGMGLQGCGTDNVAACEEWIESLNCGEYDFSSTLDCSIYESTECDISDYFDCLTENTECIDGVPDMTGWLSCLSKATCN